MTGFPSTPRMHILSGPTPLERLDRLSKVLHPNGPIVWMKRDDLTPLAMGGNKLRKLEFLLADAISQMADTVITLGAVQSNHACQTAAAARRLGLDPVLLLRGDPDAPIAGNLLLDHLLNATVRIEETPPSNWGERVTQQLKEAGRRPYLIPYGGSNAIGVLGYAAAARELVEQAENAEVDFDALVVTSSSGGTQAGLTVAQAAGWLDIPVVGISVDKDADTLADDVFALATSTTERYDLPAPERDRIEVIDEYVGPGYGKMTPEIREAISTLAQTEGVFTDPVYTGKALRGMIDLIRDGRWIRGETVLFWHTGGVPAIFAEQDILA